MARLREPTVTAETVAEYRAMSRDLRADAKDVGGFVGGYLDNGERKKGSVRFRTVLALDYDSIDPKDTGIWTLATQAFPGVRTVLHSTHSHTREQPRMRLLMQLDRELDPETYEALARRVAMDITMKGLDPGSFQPERLMHWPSRPKDGDWFFRETGDRPLDTEAQLKRYPDALDQSAWPTCPGETLTERLGHGEGKPSDPLEKEGLVGAFCRTYGIAEALETFLPGVYRKSGRNRYTYVSGSSSNGAIVYEGRWFYSNHATDPLRGLCLNAWDLVRLHRFGHLDKERGAGGDPTRLKSHKAMTELALADAGVRRTLEADRSRDFDAYEELMTGGPGRAGKAGRAGRAGSDSYDSYDSYNSYSYDSYNSYNSSNSSESSDSSDSSDCDGAWKELLKTKKDGEPLSTLANISLIILHDPRLRGLRRDIFSGNDEITGKLPWPTRAGVGLPADESAGTRQGADRLTDSKDNSDSSDSSDNSDSTKSGKKWKPKPPEGAVFWTGQDDAGLQLFMERAYGITGREKILTGMNAAMAYRMYHPVREYLNSLRWDGTARMERVIIDALGAEDDALTRAMTRIWLTAAVARIFEPGIKFDQVLILSGLEGTGKSTFFSVMGGRWFSDSLSNMDGKEGMEGNMGVWIHELSELGAMRKSDVEQVKSFVSKQTDRFRPAYERVIETRPRECVFGASTNETKFLKGMDGNRRMWVIGIDPSKRAGDGEPREWLERRRDQIWAEAVWRWREERPKLYLDKELYEASRARAKEYSFDLSESIFAELESFIDTPIPVAWDTYGLQERRDWYKGGKDMSMVPVRQRRELCIKEFLTEWMGYDAKDREYTAQSRKIGKYLQQSAVWEKGPLTRIKIYGKQQLWVRTDEVKEISPSQVGFQILEDDDQL